MKRDRIDIIAEELSGVLGVAVTFGLGYTLARLFYAERPVVAAFVFVGVCAMYHVGRSKYREHYR